MPDLTDLRFIDCNVFIGRPTVRSHWQPASAPDLVREMDRAGIAQSLVWHIAQHDAFPLLGNDLLDEAIAPHRDRLVPCWSILPPQSGELTGEARYKILYANAERLLASVGVELA